MAMVTMTCQQWRWPMATARAMADGNGNNDGWQQWQQQRLTAIATVMGMVTETATVMANGNSNGDGWWQRWWWWLTMMAMVIAAEMATVIAMATVTVTVTMTVTTTDTRGSRFMCRQRAALWQGRHLASPPWAKRSVYCPALCHLGATARSVCSISRGRDPESSPWIAFFCFFNYLISLLNNPLSPPTNSVPQEPRQPIDGLPRFLLYSLSR